VQPFGAAVCQESFCDTTGDSSEQNRRLQLDFRAIQCCSSLCTHLRDFSNNIASQFDSFYSRFFTTQLRIHAIFSRP